MRQLGTQSAGLFVCMVDIRMDFCSMICGVSSGPQPQQALQHPSPQPPAWAPPAPSATQLLPQQVPAWPPPQAKALRRQPAPLWHSAVPSHLPQLLPTAAPAALWAPAAPAVPQRPPAPPAPAPVLPWPAAVPPPLGAAPSAAQALRPLLPALHPVQQPVAQSASVPLFPLQAPASPALLRALGVLQVLHRQVQLRVHRQAPAQPAPLHLKPRPPPPLPLWLWRHQPAAAWPAQQLHRKTLLRCTSFAHFLALPLLLWSSCRCCMPGGTANSVVLWYFLCNQLYHMWSGHPVHHHLHHQYQSSQSICHQLLKFWSHHLDPSHHQLYLPIQLCNLHSLSCHQSRLPEVLRFASPSPADLVSLGHSLWVL